MKNQKACLRMQGVSTLAGIIIIIVAAIIILGGTFVYSYLTMQASKNIVAVKPTTQTAGWKTYDNFGISFQYPQNFQFPKENIYAGWEQIDFYSNPDAQPLFVSTVPQFQDASGKVYTFEQAMAKFASDKNVNSVKDVYADGIKGKEILLNSAVDGKLYDQTAYFPLNGQSYISFDVNIASMSQDIFNKLISTFKIDPASQIKTDATTGMLIYKNSDMTFEYPSKFNSDYISLNLQTEIFNSGDKNIDSNGCATAMNGNGKPGPETFQTINNSKFCLTAGADAGAGQAYNSYFYTTLKNGKYYVIEYLVHSPNACGVYENSPDVNAPGNEKYKACIADEKNWNSLVIKPIQDSIATFKFTN